MVISSARSLGSRSRAMEYRRLGTGGTAFKTIDRNRSSLLHFNAFLETKGLGLFENLEEGEVYARSICFKSLGLSFAITQGTLKQMTF